MNYLTATQVDGHSVLRHIKLGRISNNHVINLNVVIGTSSHDATRHRTESVTNIRCCLLNARSIVNNTNILQSMVLKADIDIGAIM